MYDFHKVKSDDSSTCFAHPQFYKGGKHELSSITRKLAKKDSGSEENEVAIDSLQDTVQKLQERLQQLESRDREMDWLKNEYDKIQYFISTLT